jgi:hypothetical protein
LDFHFSKSDSTSTIVIDDSKVTSDCTIAKFIFSETTVSTPGLSQQSCPSPPDASTACRSIVVPADKERLIGGILPEFKYKFVIETTGGP